MLRVQNFVVLRDNVGFYVTRMWKLALPSKRQTDI